MASAPLAPPLRRALESRLGEGLAPVRLHGGPLARWLCRRFGAAAVTLGRRVLCSADAWRRLAPGEAGGELARGTALGSVVDPVPDLDRDSVALAAHEIAHVLQYRRDGLLVVLARYALEYLRGRLAGRNHAAAYRAISYEREAFALEAAVREDGGREAGF